MVCITKADMVDEKELETARERIAQQLLEHELVCEDFGGDTQVVTVSAKTGEGMDELLEAIQLQAEVLELKAAKEGRGEAVILESYMQQGLGPVVDAIVRWGTMRASDWVVAGLQMGKVKLLENSAGERIKEAGPSVPVRVSGFRELPPAGADLLAVESEEVAQGVIAGRKAQLERVSLNVRWCWCWRCWCCFSAWVFARALPHPTRGACRGSCSNPRRCWKCSRRRTGGGGRRRRCASSWSASTSSWSAGGS